MDTERGATGLVQVEKHYTVREAAEVLRCSDKSVYRYISAGTLQAKKGVRPYLITASSLQTFLDAIGEAT